MAGGGGGWRPVIHNHVGDGQPVDGLNVRQQEMFDQVQRRTIFEAAQVVEEGQPVLVRVQGREKFRWKGRSQELEAATFAGRSIPQPLLFWFREVQSECLNATSDGRRLQGDRRRRCLRWKLAGAAAG